MDEGIVVPFELTKDTAEGVIKRAMTPLRRIIEEYKDEPDGQVEVTLTLHEIRSIDGDIGIIGMGLAQQYGKQKGWQDAIELFAQENVQLHAAVDVLSSHLTSAKNDIETLAGRLTKAETVNTKLKEIQPTGKSVFKAPDLV